MSKSNEHKWYKSATMKFGIIAMAVAFIACLIASIIVVLTHVNGSKVDVSNSAAEEFYVKQSEVQTENTTVESIIESSVEEITQAPAEIAATQEVKPEDLIGDGLSKEEWDFIYEQAEKNVPEAVKPFSIVELSNRSIKLYDANNVYYEWIPN